MHDTQSDHYDKENAAIFSRIANGTDIQQEVSLNADDGLFLMTSLEIGRDRYVNMSQFLRKRKINLPDTNKIKKRRLDVIPDLEDCFEQGYLY